jgi:hypothetical protein
MATDRARTGAISSELKRMAASISRPLSTAKNIVAPDDPAGPAPAGPPTRPPEGTVDGALDAVAGADAPAAVSCAGGTLA